MDQFDKRLDKLEDKVDAIREDVTELKTDFKIHTALIQEHVAGDAKIISELKPILHKLPDIIQIVEDHQYDRKNRERKMQLIADWTKKLTLLSTAIGVVYAIIQLF
jgi:hypothetical protein